jgi:D-glycero-beta-D-manno-heptose-7-phosphate kinase
MNINKKYLADLIDKIKPGKVLVVGDLILDEFIAGEVARISREAPIPIIHKTRHDLIPGGAANAASNIASLGGIAYSIGTIGDDYSGHNLSKVMRKNGVNMDGIVIDINNPTTTKTRVSANSRQSVIQQIARYDTLPEPPLSEDTENKVLESLEKHIRDADTILISDYNYGVISERIIAKCVELANNKIYSGKKTNLIVDSQGDLGRFQGATILTPNQPDAESVVGYEINNLQTLEKAGNQLLELTNAKSILITRGGDGMSLFESNGDITHIPAFNKREVFDVTGAGDTVVATLSLSLASGLDVKDAMYLANLAASIVIRHFGTSTASREEMKRVLLTEKII